MAKKRFTGVGGGIPIRETATGKDLILADILNEFEERLQEDRKRIEALEQNRHIHQWLLRRTKAKPAPDNYEPDIGGVEKKGGAMTQKRFGKCVIGRYIWDADSGGYRDTSDILNDLHERLQALENKSCISADECELRIAPKMTGKQADALIGAVKKAWQPENPNEQ